MTHPKDDWSSPYTPPAKLARSLKVYFGGLVPMFKKALISEGDSVPPEDADFVKLGVINGSDGDDDAIKPKMQPPQRPTNVQPAPQNGEIKAPPEVTPKMERKLTGSVKLKSTVKYDVHRPSEKEKIDAVFGAEHQRANDQRAAIMIEEIMAGMHEIYDGSIELEDNPEIVEELLKKDLDPQQTLLGLTIWKSQSKN